MNNHQIICQTKRYGKVSVVAGEYSYSAPRNSEGPYIAVEIGLWTNGPDYLAEYADGLEVVDGALRVYGYVPVELLGRLLAE